MPRINTYGDAVTDAQRLLVAMQENESVLPNVAAERTELESMLEEVQNAKSRQDFHNSERRKATQDLEAAINRYREAALQVRAAAKSGLGVRNAKLAQFRVQPLQRKGRSRTAPTTTTIKTPGATTAVVETAAATTES